MGRDSLRDAIAPEEVLLAKLETEQTESRHHLTALRAGLAAFDRAGDLRAFATYPRGAGSSLAGLAAQIAWRRRLRAVA